MKQNYFAFVLFDQTTRLKCSDWRITFPPRKLSIISVDKVQLRTKAEIKSLVTFDVSQNVQFCAL